MKRLPPFLLLSSLMVPALVWAEPALPPLDHVGLPALAFDEGRYQLGYEIYLAKGNLPAAYRVAEKAVRERPGDMAWHRRLAQVAQWLNQPDVALQHWLLVARATGDAEAWREVGRMAPMLADDEAWLVWQRHEAGLNPGDTTRMNTLLAAYEKVGRPEEGLAFLAALRRTHPTRALYEAEALLAERSGKAELALANLAVLNRRYGLQEGWLLRAAGLHYQHGELEQAQKVLSEAAPQMPDTASGFWQTHAELARLLDDEPTALAAYQHLYASGTYTQSDLINYAALLQERDPLAAARLQALLFERFGRIQAANSALYLWDRENNPAAAEAFLQKLTSPQLAVLENDAGFHEFRGRLRQSQGRWREAMADYAAGLRLAPARASLQQAWLALLIERGDGASLRRLLLEGSDRARRTPALWSLWAAGWSRLEEPVRALPYLKSLHDARPTDALVTLAYADALARAGLVDTARQLENQVWQSRQQALTALPAASQLELRNALVALELERLPPDARRRHWQQLLRERRDNTGQVSPWVRDLVLAAAWASDAPDSLPADVTARVPAAAPLPAWSPLLAALGGNDLPALDVLLDQRLDELPVYDRVEAAERLDRFDLAATLAFDTAELRPDDDEIHRRFQERAFADGSWLDLSAQQDKQGSLTRTPLTLEGKTALSGNMHVQWLAESAGLDSDPALLRLPMDSQQRVEAGVGRKGDTQDWELALTAFDSLDAVAGLRGSGRWQAGPGVQMEARAGWQQRTTATSALTVGGMRNLAGLGLGWAVTGRDSLALDLEYSQLQSQGGGALGSTLTGSLNVAHRLFSGERDWVLKTGISTTSSSTADTLPADLQPLLPAGLAAGADYFVPQAFTQFSLALAFGENAEQSFQRGWRTFWQAGLTQDADTGLGYDYRFGVLGRVLGRDRLRFFIKGADGAQGNGESTQTLNADYRIFY